MELFNQCPALILCTGPVCVGKSFYVLKKALDFSKNEKVAFFSPQMNRRTQLTRILEMQLHMNIKKGNIKTLSLEEKNKIKSLDLKKEFGNLYLFENEYLENGLEEGFKQFFIDFKEDASEIRLFFIDSIWDILEDFDDEGFKKVLKRLNKIAHELHITIVITSHYNILKRKIGLDQYVTSIVLLEKSDSAPNSIQLWDGEGIETFYFYK